jgi:MoxR-like ATPase
MNAAKFSNLFRTLSAKYPDKNVFTTKEIYGSCDECGVSKGKVYNEVMTSENKVSRGVWNLEAYVVPFRSAPLDNNINSMRTKMASVQSVTNEVVYVPEVDQTYVSWGNYKDIKTIIESGMFFPTFITGLSGNGKTMMVEQCCAKLKREYVRIQITPETDEDDLIGGFRLIEGETVFQKGPVVKAMESGAILLIDEIDRSSNRLMALQGVLEGKPIMIKKTGDVIKPAPGFNVIATANTKGQGSDDGKYVAATIIDEAFLERFSITIEQPFPSIAVEKKIVHNHMLKFNGVDDDFCDKLTTWSDIIRKTYEDGGVEDIVSTRRLCHIAQTFAIFKDRLRSIELCVNRYDEDTKAAFIDLYTKVDSTGSDDAGAETLDSILSQIDQDIEGVVNV